jgi:hypothetical protein
MTMANAAARMPQRGLAGDQAVRAVGGDEIDQRLRVLQVLHEVDPAGVGLELAVAVIDRIAARGVQRQGRGRASG